MNEPTRILTTSYEDLQRQMVTKKAQTKKRSPKKSSVKKSETPGLWLVKQEPETYSWDDFVRDGRTDWTGVRNFQARNNLRQMRVGERVQSVRPSRTKSSQE